MTKKLFFAAAAIALASPVSAQNERTTRVGVNNDGSQVVCRQEQEIGTRLRMKRVCRTRAEWTQLRRELRFEVDRAQQQMQTR